MSILKYRAFLTTIEHNSLTKAAEVLGYTQPGISHMISSLERELGFPLLVRAKDGVFPTENARYLQYYMRQIISNDEALMETAYQIRGMERGSLKIGTFYSTSTHWLPEIVSRFLSEHPNIILGIDEGTHDEMNEWLTQGKVDIAITSLPVPAVVGMAISRGRHRKMWCLCTNWWSTPSLPHRWGRMRVSTKLCMRKDCSPISGSVSRGIWPPFLLSAEIWVSL